MRFISSLCKFGFCVLALSCITPVYAESQDTGESRWLDAPVPQQWRQPDYLPQSIQDNGDWWLRFGDSTLDSLINMAVENNYSLAGATRRIAMARAELGRARASYYPQLGLTAGWTRERGSGMNGNVPGSASTADYFTGSVSMSWEVDVFGKITAQVRQNKAQVQVSAAEYGAVLISLRAQVASTYFSLLTSREQLHVAQTHAVSQEGVVNTAVERFESGLASKLDVAQARTMYYSTIAQIPLLESSIQSSINALCVLTGVDRGDLPGGVWLKKPIPDWRQAVGLGVPLDLLRRRPDVVQAEKQIDASAAALGIARREYLPSLTLNGSVGTSSHRFGDLFTGPSFTYSIAPTLSWTIFDGLGRRYANIEAQEQLQASVDAYNLSVLTAIEEVRNAAARYGAYLEYMNRTATTVQNAEESVRLSVTLYRQGLTAFTNVNDAELSFLTYENNLVSAQGEALSALVDLYKALGGGWDPDNSY